MAEAAHLDWPAHWPCRWPEEINEGTHCRLIEKKERMDSSCHLRDRRKDRGEKCVARAEQESEKGEN